MTLACVPVPYAELSAPARTVLLISAGAFLAGELAQAFRSRRGATRLRVEERALTAALGDRYRVFAASRARLVPYIW